MKKLSIGNRCLTIKTKKEMKKNLFMVAAVALMALVSCNKEVTTSEEIAPVGETVTFEASVDGAETKVALNGKMSNWENGDKITIHNGDGGYEFATTDEGTKANFTYVGDDFSGDKFIAVYPAGSYTADVEAKTVNAYIPTYQKANLGGYSTYSEEGLTSTLAIAYSENQSLQFKNACALLKFTVSNENITHVKFYGNNEEAISGNMLVTLAEDNTIKTVEGQKTSFTWPDKSTTEQFGTWVEMHAYESENDKFFKAGEENVYYIAVAPHVFAKGFAIKVIIDEVEHEVKKYEKEYTLKPNTILNLGTLSYDPNKVDASAYGLVGSFQTPTTWDVANPVAMEYVSDGWIVAKNVELYKNDEFKFVKDKSWDVSYGTSSVTVLENNVEAAVVTSGSQNMKVSKNGKYNLYLNPYANKVKVECVEEYTDLKVNITIDNKANWSPLYITLKNGNEVIADNATVTNNKYQISGDYIGSTLTCTLSNGTKTSDVMNVAITKTGATVTLEETIIKLKVQLNTANAKQWWGNTMKIHVWDTGTSFDTSWPGNTMTSEGNYTWSIIVPSELVGKTIKYLVHNGNGWQSKDSTVTIKAEGNTVTGSTIGIN